MVVQTAEGAEEVFEPDEEEPAVEDVQGEEGSHEYPPPPEVVTQEDSLLLLRSPSPPVVFDSMD